MEKKGLSTMALKIIAIICMVIDHIAFYFEDSIDTGLCLVMRVIGRLAMPIFLFLIINGFFKTKNLKRYILRLFRLAVFTQLVIWILGVINYNVIDSFNSYINTNINIVFSFVLILILIKSINEIMAQRKHVFMNSIVMLIIYLIYIAFNMNPFITIDYDINLMFLAIIYYVAFSFKNNNINIYNVILTIGIVFIAVLSSIDLFMMLGMIFVIPILLLYNEKEGYKSLKLQSLFYSIFPIQHFILYGLWIVLEYQKII